MTVVAIGLNHRTAPPLVLEQVTFGADDLPKLLTQVSGSDVVNEAVVLSTCNRTELYVHAERFHDAFRHVRDALGLLTGLAVERFDPYLYVHYHADAARHLFEVAAGLDSVVLGEHEILGQVVRAWDTARTEGRSGPVLNLLFQRAIESGKKVRTDTDIGRSTASLSHAAVTLLAERRAIDGGAVLLVGAGELGADVATALTRKHDVDLVVTNRTPARGAELAERLGARTAPFADLQSLVTDADIVVTATGAPGIVLDIDVLAGAVARGRSVLVLDLAQPRDVPIEAGHLDGVELVELVELQSFANRGLDARRQHVGAARAILSDELERYQAASSAREVAPLIGSLHAWADGVRAGELERYAARMATMDATDRRAFEALSRSLVAKLLHQPTVSLKDAAGTPRGDRLAEAVRELFDQS
ncbi:MAG: glutamyl-tRNA reductase [Acidimicrobiales bacterium]